MGTYITTAVEVLGPDGWQESEAKVFTTGQNESSGLTEYPFDWQQYVMFSLFANERTEDHGIVPVAPNRGLPEDASDGALGQILGGWGAHNYLYPDASETAYKTVAQKVANSNRDETYGFSWFTARELQAVDYEVRITSMQSPHKSETLREALGDLFFENLDQLSGLGSPDHVRVLFCFVG